MKTASTVKRLLICSLIVTVSLIFPETGISAPVIKPLVAVDGNDLFPSIALDAHLLFAKKVQEKTNGRLLIKTVSSAVLGGTRECMEAVMMADIQITHTHNTIFGKYYEPLMLFDLPFLFRDDEHMYKVTRGPIGQKLHKELEKKTRIMMLQLGRGEGARSFFNKLRPIRKPEDLKGMKLRVMESPLTMDTLRALGATPTPMPSTDVYLSIKQGIIDGGDLPEWAYLSQHQEEVAKYVSLTRHYNMPGGLGCNADWFAGLPKDIQTAVIEAANESLVWHDAEFKKEVARNHKEIREKGGIINEVEDINLFRDKVKSIYEKYAEKVGGMSLINEVIAVK